MDTVVEPHVIQSLKIQVDNDIATRPNRLSNGESMDESEEEEGEISAGEEEVEVNVIVGTDKHDDNYYSNGDLVRKDLYQSKNSKELAFYRPPASRDRPRSDKKLKPGYERSHRPKHYSSDLKRRREDLDLSFESEEFFVQPPESLLEERAKRFGINSSSKPTVSKTQIQNLYKSLEVSEDDFHRGGWRAEAIHIRGIENLGSSEIFKYFKNHIPHSIERLNKTSCNVVWVDKEQAIKALIGLSCPILPAKHSSVNVKPKTKKTIKTKESDKPLLKSKTEEVTEKPQKEKSSSKSAESSDSDSSSSSSCEDEDGSSSDSSSSSSSSGSGSSSSSSSSSSTSSSDSSSSSSESEDEEETSTAKKVTTPVVKLEPKGKTNIESTNDTSNNNNNNNNNESLPTQMEVDDNVEAPNADDMIGSVSADYVGIPIPPGRWRLGVPCPNTKAILMRYAHCKDKKLPGLEKRIELYQAYESKKNKRTPTKGRVKRDNYKVRHRPMKHVEEDYLRSPPLLADIFNRQKVVRYDVAPAPLGVARSYKDLDDPVDDNKNPWGFLAQNWGRKETQDNIDYQELLRQHETGQKRKRSRSDDEEEEANEKYRPERYPRRSRPRLHTYKHRRVDYDEEEDYAFTERNNNDDEDDDVVAWKKKIKLPMMRMYADAEEKKKDRKRDVKSIEKRLSLGQNVWRENRRQMPSSLDLRTKLLKKKKYLS